MLSSKAYSRVAAFAAGLALVVVVVGAYVRLSHAGLSCPDWPGCYGQLVVPGGAEEAASANLAYPERPLDADRAWKEMIHRYLAGLLGLVIVFMAVAAYSRRHAPGQQLLTPTVLVVLVLFQALLGMWTVTLLLKPLVVVGHLLGGLTTASLCWWIFLRQSARPNNDARSDQRLKLPRRLAAVAIAVLLVQIGLGGWTSANYAALACVDFPSCQGQLWPDMAIKEAFVPWRGLGQSYEGGVLENDARVAIHVFHRLGALVTFVLLGGVAAYLMRSRLSRRLARAAGVMLLFLIAQVSLGIANVLLHLPLGVAVAHNAVAALLLLSVVSVYHMAAPPKPRP